MGGMIGAPRSEQFDDVYFSAHDGPGETCHVFLDGNGLPARWQGPELRASRRFCIGETGFGTGLNFLLAWELFDRTAPKDAFLDFVSVEKFPLAAEEIQKGLSPWADRLQPYLSRMIAQYPARIPGFHRMVFDNRVALTLIFDDANIALAEIEGQVDAWFLDGFTPSKNPDMWTEEVFMQMGRLSHADTTFSTFTAAGFVKRGLQEAGFTVEKRKGFGPKRDMLSGRFSGNKKKAYARTVKTVAIHGAGLAGCAAAYVLRQYGFDPVLYDPNGIASGASGNSAGLINPRFTSFRSPESDFYASGFAHTMRSFPTIGANYIPCGALHLITDEDKEKRFSRTLEHWGWQDGLMRHLEAPAASDVAGAALSHAALYLPASARISPVALCQAYTDGVHCTSERPEGDAVILANGIAALEHPALAGMPLNTVRGQITEIETPAPLRGQKTNICYGGYVSAPMNGRQMVGSTFQKWLSDTTPRDEDNNANLEKLHAVLPQVGEMKILSSRAALRVASRDRFPLIGRVDETTLVSTAHGSHGILSTLIGAHILADALRGGIACLGKSTLNRLSFDRFNAALAKKDTNVPWE
jgi:tRNA 5-methylaminomethyl-2-thiouridine biosynthesis bifunctional protein